jgi:hypothetical protein
MQTINRKNDEKNISTFQQKEKEQARVQGKNVQRQRSQGTQSPQGQGTQEIVGL